MQYKVGDWIELRSGRVDCIAALIPNASSLHDQYRLTYFTDFLMPVTNIKRRVVINDAPAPEVMTVTAHMWRSVDGKIFATLSYEGETANAIGSAVVTLTEGEFTK